MKHISETMRNQKTQMVSLCWRRLYGRGGGSAGSRCVSGPAPCVAEGGNAEGSVWVVAVEGADDSICFSASCALDCGPSIVISSPLAGCSDG